MGRSLFTKLWNASPKTVAERLFPGFFYARRPLNLNIGTVLELEEINRLKKLPRYTKTSAQFMGKRLEIVDADSFLSMCDEIFVRNNYEFESSRKNPLIIDCGANIGMSILFFKKLYPDCKIIAFEPDRGVFKALQSNIESFGLQHVELHNKAVWSSETELQFLAEGSWGGRIPKPGDGGNMVTVKTIRLKDYLKQNVDFLKIDVEGAETEILRDCAGELKSVANLFLEYHSYSKEKQSLQEILTILQDAGFRYHIKEAAIRKTPYIEKSLPGMDSQLDIFAFRP